MLLFGTNLVAIVAIAGIVFVLTGYVAWSQLRSEQRRVRASYATVAAGVVLLLIPLGLTARNLIDEASAEHESQAVVDEWLGHASGFRVTNLEVAGRRVLGTLLGPGLSPSAQALHDSLENELGDRVVLELRVVPEVLHLIEG